MINLLGTSLVESFYMVLMPEVTFMNSDMDVMILTSLDDLEEAGIRKIENSIYDIASNLHELSENVHISVSIKNIDHFGIGFGTLPYYDNVEKEDCSCRMKEKALCGIGCKMRRKDFR